MGDDNLPDEIVGYYACAVLILAVLDCFCRAIG